MKLPTERPQPPVRAGITAVAGWLPPDRLTNADLEQLVETNDAWIQERTGIHERRIYKGEGGASAIGLEALKRLCRQQNLDPADIDLLICATVSPDRPMPSTALLMARELGATNAWGFDLHAACSGFLYGLQMAAAQVETGRYAKVVVVGTEKMSSIIDYTDRSTCIIFGDGAGAVLLEPVAPEYGLQDGVLYSDGWGEKNLYIPAGGSARPASHATVDAREHYVKQDGKAVFKEAVLRMAQVSQELLARNNLQPEQVDWLVPHQANQRIIDATATRLGLPPERVMSNIAYYGNTTAATLPLCLWDYEPQLKAGDNLLLAAFGGGYTWGGLYLKWAYNGAPRTTPAE